MSQSKFGFFVALTEYERGWGSKPDGYLVFLDESAAKSFIEAEYAERVNKFVPDYYINYKMSGWRPIHDGLYAKVVENGRVHVD